MKEHDNDTISDKEIDLYINKTKQIISLRNEQILKGFVYKGYEECSFNDFYSNGNEYILKYGGIINGMLRKYPNLLKNASDDVNNKIQVINDKIDLLIQSDVHHRTTYNIFFRSSTYCIEVCSDDVYKFKNLAKEDMFHAITSFSSANNFKDTDPFKSQKLKELLELGNRQNIVNERLLTSSKNLKRNAFYSLKKLEIFLEKNDYKSDVELKNLFLKSVQEEKQCIDNLVTHRNERFEKKESYFKQSTS